jgi:hypothetical protein
MRLSLLLVMAGPPLRAQLDQNCTISVLNRNVRVNTDGTWVLPNVPANQGRVRARATCTLNGLTRFGQSDLFTVPLNGSVTLQPIIFGTISPIPSLLTLTATPPTISTLGQTSQIKVVATYPDSHTADVTTFAAGTNYSTSNSAVATVSTDGLVRAVSNGTVIITAYNEGTSGSTQVTIGIPPQITITSPTNGATVTQGGIVPITAQVTGGATVLSVSFSINGRIEFTTTYHDDLTLYLQLECPYRSLVIYTRGLSPRCFG